MTSTEHARQADLLIGLPAQARSMAAPCRMHPAVAKIDHYLLHWLRDCGLVADEPARQQTSLSMSSRFAARLLPDTDIDNVVLLSKWIAWLLFLDDELDTGPMAVRPEAIDQCHNRLLTTLRRGVPSTTVTPIERALMELWISTSQPMSRDWAARFQASFQQHWAASRQQAVNRRDRRTPSLGEYVQLRRAAGGPFMFDLAEPLLRIEVPIAIVASQPWTSLREAVNDIIVWCNDVASHPQEGARHDIHNYVHIAAAELGLGTTAAIHWVTNQIAMRDDDIRAALRSLPAEFSRAGLTQSASRDISKVACGLASMPRAHLEWVRESQRYRPMP